MQGEKEMKGKVLIELEGGERRTDGWTHGLTDRLTYRLTKLIGFKSSMCYIKLKMFSN